MTRICGVVGYTAVWSGGLEEGKSMKFTAVHAAAPSIQRPPIFTPNLIRKEEDSQKGDVVLSSSNRLQNALCRCFKTYYKPVNCTTFFSVFLNLRTILSKPNCLEGLNLTFFNPGGEDGRSS